MPVEYRREGACKLCPGCGRFMPIDAGRRLLPHANLLTGRPCLNGESELATWQIVVTNPQTDRQYTFYTFKQYPDTAGILWELEDTTPIKDWPDHWDVCFTRCLQAV